MPRVTSSPSGAYTVDISYQEMGVWCRYNKVKLAKCAARIAFDENGAQTYITEKLAAWAKIDKLANDLRACVSYAHATARGWVVDPTSPFYERHLVAPDSPLVRAKKPKTDYIPILREAFLSALVAEGSNRLGASRFKLLLIDEKIRKMRAAYRSDLASADQESVKTHYEWVRTIERAMRRDVAGESAITILTQVRKEHIAEMQATHRMETESIKLGNTNMPLSLKRVQ